MVLHLSPTTCSSAVRSRCAPVLLAGLMAVIAACATACDGGDLEPERIPGTERIEPGDNSPWFTISPDERWLAFMEVDSGYGASSAPRRFHLATVDLASLVKTHHDVRNVPSGTFPPPDRTDSWQRVHMDLGTSSWFDGRLFVQIRWNPPGSPWIAFKPGAAAAELVNAPGELGCSDCAPPNKWDEMKAARRIHPDNEGVTVAYGNGEFSQATYLRGGREYKDAVIERVDPDGTRSIVIEKKRMFKDADIGDLRVSPNERYLAYALTTHLKSPVPLPTLRDEVYVLDLQTGAELRVPGDFRITGNLIWSADSKRLYYAAANGPVADGIGDGVYKIDLSREAK